MDTMKPVKRCVVGVLALLLLVISVLGMTGSHASPAATGFSDVSIVKPAPALYVFDVELVPLPAVPTPFQAIVIGKITVEAEAPGPVSFYVDGELRHTDSEAPYTWVWDEGLRPPPIHTLRAESSGGSDEIGVLYVNPFGG